jgi:hypothetical protein
MKQFSEMSPEEWDKMSKLIEHVYGNAYCALELGVPKEVLVEQIE